MFNYLKNHKKLLIGCGCALLAIALVACLVLANGNGAGDKPTLPSNGTNGTTQGTTPDGTTNPTDGTITPTGPDASDPTEPSSGVTGPTVPTIDLTEPTPEPTEPPHTYPTEPNGDIIPVDPNEGTQPTAPTTPTVTPVDLGGITVDTITHEIYKNWTSAQRVAFMDYFYENWDTWTLDQRYYAKQQMSWTVCGWIDEELMAQGIYVSDMESYEHWLARKELGCDYCADTDCIAFYTRDDSGYSGYDGTKCPYYNEKYDPSVYCQECGYKKFTKCASGEIGCTRVISKNMPCPDCGETVYVGKCHNCVHP